MMKAMKISGSVAPTGTSAVNITIGKLLYDHWSVTDI